MINNDLPNTRMFDIDKSTVRHFERRRASIPDADRTPLDHIVDSIDRDLLPSSTSCNCRLAPCTWWHPYYMCTLCTVDFAAIWCYHQEFPYPQTYSLFEYSGTLLNCGDPNDRIFASNTVDVRSNLTFFFYNFGGFNSSGPQSGP